MHMQCWICFPVAFVIITTFKEELKLLNASFKERSSQMLSHSTVNLQQRWLKCYVHRIRT